MTIVHNLNFDFVTLKSFIPGYNLDIGSQSARAKTSIIFWETSSITENEFWHILNPSKEDQYAEIRPAKYLTLLHDKNISDYNTSRNVPSSQAGWKLIARTILRKIIWFLKFAMPVGIAIAYAILYLVSYLVPSDLMYRDDKLRNNMDNILVLSSTCRGETRSIIVFPKVITLRGRHSADVDLLCANSNGMIISTSTDKHITSWDGKQGIYLKKLERYMRRCESCKCRITGGLKKCISWPVRTMCMNEKVGWAAAGFEDGVIRVWDIHSGQVTYILKDTVEDVESVISVMTGNSIKERVTCLQIVVPNSYSKPNSSNNESGYHNNFKSNSNNTIPTMLLATYRSGYFREWDIVSGQIVHTIATNQKGGISYLFVVEGKQNYNQDDLRIYTGARDGSVKCWIRTIYNSENESKSSSSDPSELPKSRWKSFYTIPGELGNVITCITAKVIKTRNNSFGILVTGASDGEVRAYDYSSGKYIVTLSQGTTEKQRRAKEREQQLLQKRLLQQRIIKNQQQFIRSNGHQHNIKSNGQQQFIRSNGHQPNIKSNGQQQFIRSNGHKPNFYSNQESEEDDDEYDDDEYDDDDSENEDETDDDSDLPHHQDVITNIIIHPLKEQSCPCGNAEGAGGFTIITSSKDEKVHIWQLTRDFMDCTCMALKIGNNNFSQARNNTGQLHRQVAQWNGVVSYQTKYVGCVNQSGGSAIVLLRENIIGVRRVKPLSHKSTQVPKRCHGAEGEWELWVLDINEPHVVEEKEDHENSNDDDDDDEVELNVQVLPLVNEEDLIEQQQQKKKKEEQRDQDRTGKLNTFTRSTNSNNNTFPSPPFPTSFPSNTTRHDDHHHHSHEHDHDHHHEDDDTQDVQDTQGQVIDFRQSGLRRRTSVLHRVYPNNIINDRQLAILDEEDEMNEILPFAYIRQAVKVGDDGVAVAYGNFIKYIQFEKMVNEKNGNI